jgi:hypothetical protein
MSESDIKAIALFFFYALLDDRKALEVAGEALEMARRRLAANTELKNSVAIVAATKQIWEKHSGQFVRGRPNYSLESGWLVPQGLDLGPWKEFQKSAQEDEFLCLIWSKILKISDEDISQGLGISVGTLRYRIGRALRKLGMMANPVSTRPLGVVK